MKQLHLKVWLNHRRQICRRTNPLTVQLKLRSKRNLQYLQNPSTIWFKSQVLRFLLRQVGLTDCTLHGNLHSVPISASNISVQWCTSHAENHAVEISTVDALGCGDPFNDDLGIVCDDVWMKSE